MVAASGAILKRGHELAQVLKVFDKLEVADRTHAVTVALERGIL